MIFSRSSFSIAPFTREVGTDLSTVPKIYALLANPDAPRNYVLQVEPYWPEGATTLEQWYAAGDISIPGFSGVWTPRIVEAFNVTTDLFASTELGFGGGGGRPSYGEIVLAIGDNADRASILRDEFTWLDWRWRRLRLYLGGPAELGWTWSEYVTLFDGVCEDVVWNDDRLAFIVRDPSVELDAPVQPNLYAGTGGDEGGDDLKGKPKPLCFGRPRNVQPVMVDRTALVLQVHDGPIDGIDALYDRGDGYAYYDGDQPGAALRAYVWDPALPKGRYITDKAKGLIRVDKTPNGVVTASVRGDLYGGRLREYQGEVVYRMLTGWGGWTNADFDLASLGALDANLQEIAYFVAEPKTAAAAIDEILKPYGYRTTDTAGRLALGRVAFGPPVLMLAPPAIVAIARERTAAPLWRLSFGYARNWTLMREADLTVPADRDISTDFATNEYRRVTVEDASLLTRTLAARDLTEDSLFSNADDATTQAAALFSLVSTPRDTYRIVAARIQFRVRVGQTVRVQYPRFGLFDGRDFLCLSVTENTSLGQTELILWG